MENETQDRVALNRQLAQMLKGGVIMDVTTPEQARIAEEAGACAVMALERIPADIRAAGGVSRMSDPAMIRGIQEAVSIPVMAKCRIGHIVEAQILQAIEIDYVDESEVLTPADDTYHIDKTAFDVPFVCGARDLGEALRRIAEGATMIRTKGEPGTGDVVQAVRHMRKIQKQIRDAVALRDDELFEAAKQLGVPVSSAPRASSWVPASSRAAIPPSAPTPSSRPSQTTRTPSSSPSSPKTSARPWWASTPTRSTSSWKSVAANGAHDRSPRSPRRLRRARADARPPRRELARAQASV